MHYIADRLKSMAVKFMEGRLVISFTYHFLTNFLHNKFVILTPQVWKKVNVEIVDS